MEGIEILNKTMVTEPIIPLCLLGIIGTVVGGVMFMIGYKDETFDYWWLNLIFCIVGGVIFIAGCINLGRQRDTGRYQYEATIDESVSMTEVHEKYKVIEQKGKIWILEDKEVK